MDVIRKLYCLILLVVCIGCTITPVKTISYTTCEYKCMNSNCNAAVHEDSVYTDLGNLPTECKYCQSPIKIKSLGKDIFLKGVSPQLLLDGENEK